MSGICGPTSSTRSSRLCAHLSPHRHRARTTVQPLSSLAAPHPPRRSPLSAPHARLRQHAFIRQALESNPTPINLHGEHPFWLPLIPHTHPIPRAPAHPPRLSRHHLPRPNPPLLPMERHTRPLPSQPRPRTLHASPTPRSLQHAPLAARPNQRTAAPQVPSSPHHGARKRRHGLYADCRLHPAP